MPRSPSGAAVICPTAAVAQRRRMRRLWFRRSQAHRWAPPIRPRPFLLTLALFAAPAVLWLGLWSPAPVGFDAVSAATPAHVAVVGAAAPSAAGAPSAPTPADLARRVGYLSGSGLHRAVDPQAEWVLLRPGHAAARDGDIDRHVEVVRAIVTQVHEIAPGARISLLAGGVPGSGVAAGPRLARALAAVAANSALAGALVEVLDLGVVEIEQAQVPDGGLAADVYPVPIPLLEADAVINVAFGAGRLSALANLEGLAGPAAAPTRGAGSDRLVDLALLCEVDYTVLDLLGRNGPPLLLASRDGIAVDRVEAALAGGDSTAEATLLAAAARHLGQARLADVKVSGFDVPGTWVPAPDTTAVPGRS